MQDRARRPGPDQVVIRLTKCLSYSRVLLRSSRATCIAGLDMQRNSYHKSPPLCPPVPLFCRCRKPISPSYRIEHDHEQADGTI